MEYKGCYWYRYSLVFVDHILRLYQVTISYGWVGGGVLDCPASEVTPRVSMYSLRKPLRTNSSRYLQRLLQWMVLCPLLS